MRRYWRQSCTNLNNHQDSELCSGPGSRVIVVPSFVSGKAWVFLVRCCVVFVWCGNRCDHVRNRQFHYNCCTFAVAIRTYLQTATELMNSFSHTFDTDTWSTARSHLA